MAQNPIRPNPNIGLEFDLFELNDGLDLISPKIMAKKGSMLSCLNREIIDSIGYRRIDGFNRYDGRVSPAQDDIFLIYNTSYGSGVTTDFAAGDCLVITGTTNIFGVVVSSSYTASGTVARIYYARVNKDYEPTTSDTVAVITEAQTFAVTGGIYSVTQADPVTSTTSTAQEVVDTLNTDAAALRSRITALHDTPIGLHWYRDKLYAVVTDRSLYFNSGGTTEILPNWYIQGATSGAKGRVLYVELKASGGGSWAGGDASGLIQYELIGTTAFQTGEDLNYDDNSAFSSPTNNVATLRAEASGDPEPEFASLWRSRSEQQAVDDGDTVADAGWTRIDHGWEFDFTDGFSDTGAFTKVERGSTTNFSYTSGSTSVSGTNGSPTTVYNGSNVQGTTFAPLSAAITQPLVSDGNPGWKTTASSSAFATGSELDTAIAAADSTKAYANIMYQLRADYGSNLRGMDKDIWGPAAPASTGTFGDITIGAVTLDSDWFTTQARAPIILKDLSAAASLIPEGSLISGIEVTVSYSSRHQCAGRFQESRISLTTFRDDVLSMIANNFAFEACVVDVTSSVLSTLVGSAQQSTITVEPDTADYTTATTTSGGSDIHQMAQTADLTGLTCTIGGDGNTFGLGTTSRDDFLDASRGIAVYGQIIGAPTFSSGLISYIPSGTTRLYENMYGQIRLTVDKIKVKFYYTEPSARYYVGDGAGNVCSVDLVYTVQEDGSFTASTASGSLQVTNLVADVAGSKRRVENTDTLHLTSADAAAGTGSIATVASDMAYNGFPSLDRIVDESSRYQFITANFFGREDWDGFYGVNGADRAFSFSTFDADGVGGDEDYVIRIVTNTNDISGDKPRHIAFHHYALALGYKAGIVRFSVLGEPENFDGALGAAEIGVGDKVTGLLSMRGMTLGVFCENSIWGIAGTDSDNYDTQVLAPATGALEYTCVDVGVPVYCDSRGISTLEQSAAYGNFVGQRLSKPVTPWIIPRMVRNPDLFSVANGSGVVCAIPVRAKNQYLVFFKDGYVLRMTMNPDGTYAFTYSQYYIGQSAVTETTKFLVPFAWSSQVDNNGVERIHVSHYSPLSDVTTANGKYVYELEDGWSFDGNFIPAEYSLNWYFKSPFQEATIKKIRMDGLTRGVSSCKVYTAKDYDTTYSTNSVDMSLTSSSYSTDFEPATTMSYPTVRGRSVTIKVKDEVQSGDSITDPVPPDIHQIMLVQTDSGGKQDA